MYFPPQIISRAKALIIPKSKSEIRSTKFETDRGQISQTPSNSKTTNPNQGCLEHCVFWSFEFVSDFGFRASSFLFSVLCAFARDDSLPNPDLSPVNTPSSQSLGFRFWII
jgi:hypothetical protein